MIISHKHKFIFIKVKKTAGTSMEIALSGLCGADDIITPISKMDELMRKDLGFRCAQNYQHNGYFNHMHAKDVCREIGQEIWDSYFKFCFERNPWDKVLSFYFFKIGNGMQMSFDDFIKSRNFSLVGDLKGLDYYTDEEGSVLVDKIYLYEDMSNALADLAKRFNINKIPELPNAKGGYRTNRKPNSELYSDANREIVRQEFEREIELFDYRF